MKKRSIQSIFLLEIFTLGLYELYWLYKTRNELVRKFRTNIPSAWWLILAKTLQLAIILFVVYAVVIAIPANNRRINNLTRPSPECFIEYSDSKDAERAGRKSTVSQTCEAQIDEYFKTDSTATLLLAVFGLYAASFIMFHFLLKNWYVPYSEAIVKASKQKLNSNYTFVLLMAPFGFLAIQSIYNKT